MQRANPNDEDAPKKWYVTQVTAAQVDETQVAMDLADETTLNPAETKEAVTARNIKSVNLNFQPGSLPAAARMQTYTCPDTENYPPGYKLAAAFPFRRRL